MDAQKIGAITAKLGLDLSAEEVEAVAVKAQELVDAAGDDGVPGPTSAMASLDDAVARAGCGPFSLAPAGESTAFTISGTVSPGYVRRITPCCRRARSRGQGLSTYH